MKSPWIFKPRLMNVANANELRGVRGACRVPCACTATLKSTVHVHDHEAQSTTLIKVCQEQNNAKQLARDWREILRRPDNLLPAKLLFFATQRRDRKLPSRRP